MNPPDQLLNKPSNPWRLGRDNPNNFNLLRLILSVLVVYSHTCNLFNAPEWDVLHFLSGAQMLSGSFAVNAFFTISGFLIVHSWLSSKGQWDYLSKRILRILPAFVGMIIFCTFVILPLAQTKGFFLLSSLDPSTILMGIPQFSLNLPNIFPKSHFDGLINNSLWTIHFEFQCYVIVLILGIAGLYRKRLAVLLLWLATYLVYCTDPVALRFSWPRLLCFFLSGVVFYLYQNRIRYSGRLFIACLFALLAGALIKHNAYIYLSPIFSTYVLFYIAFTAPKQIQKLTPQADISYGIYLFAAPIQQLLVLYFFDRLNIITHFILSVMLTIIPATLSWFIIEKPCLEAKSTNKEGALQAGKHSFVEQAVSLLSRFTLYVIAFLSVIGVSLLYFGSKAGKMFHLVTHQSPPSILVNVVAALCAVWLGWGLVTVWQDIQILRAKKIVTPSVNSGSTQFGGDKAEWLSAARTRMLPYLPLYYVAVLYTVLLSVRLVKDFILPLKALLHH